MTIEELDIVVQASVDRAVKEFKKLLPEIQKQLSGIKKEFDKLNIKDIKANMDFKSVTKEVQKAKKQMKDAFDPNDVSGIKINGKNGYQIFNSIAEEIEKSAGKFTEYKKAVTSVNGELDKTKSGKFVGYDTNSIQNFIDDYREAGRKVDEVKEKTKDLKKENDRDRTTQNKLSSFFSDIKIKIGQAKTLVSGLKIGFNQIPSITQKITANIKKMNTRVKSGLGHIIKYAGTLFSLRSIYSILNSSASSWLSSQNAGAQQLSANINYMKYAMDSAFAPVIEYVTNLVYQLMKAIQSVVYMFSGINIFAKATASSMKSTAGSAKQASKSLSSVHSEINNVSENNSGGGGSASPNIDLSKMDNQMGPLAQKLYDFFKPLKESWDNYGNMVIEQLKVTAGQIGGLISTVWQSFEKIITNGTIYKTLKLILAIIGNIAQAFKNAWENNGNGDKIVQNLADAFNNLLTIINNIVSSNLSQWILDIAVGAIKIVTDALKGLTDAVLWVTEKIGDFIGFFTGENSEKLDGWSIIIGSIATAIGLVVAVIELWNIVSAIATIATTAFAISVYILTSPITLVILAIGALIAVIVSIITYWDEISEALQNGWEFIKQKAEDIFGAIADFFANTWNNVLNTTSNVWNTIVSKVKEGVSGAWNAITSTFGNVAGWFRDKFTQAWQAVKNVFSAGGAIFDGIKDGILNGLKTVINGLIQGINKVIKVPFDGLNSALNTIRNVGIGDLKPFTGLPSISVPQIPQLAKGGVLYDDTIVRVGEYSGASSNPEIVSPQSIMYDTMRRALEDNSFFSNNNQDIYLTLQVGDEELGQVVIDILGNIKRRTGKGLEVLIGG